jgi:hypothetical protein
MGTGGATALGSPECDAGLAASPLRGEQTGTELWRRYRSWKELSAINCCRSADIYIQEFISAETADGTTELRFVFRSFDLLCMPSFAEANDGLTEK